MITYRKVILMVALQMACVVGLVILSWLDSRFNVQFLLLFCFLIFNVKIYLWWRKWINSVFHRSEMALGKRILNKQSITSILTNLDTNLDQLKLLHAKQEPKDEKVLCPEQRFSALERVS